MEQEKRGCENCGNDACAQGMIAFNWDECVESNFTKHWKPQNESEVAENED